MILDIGAGAGIAGLFGLLAGMKFSPALILFSVAAALAPDIDFIVWLVRKRGTLDEWSHRHRDLLHYPLVFVPAGYVLSALLFRDHRIAALFAFAPLYHFIHDTFGPGWGIRWLWPFDRRYFMIWIESGGIGIRRWTKTEQDEIARIHGDPQWAKKQFDPGHTFRSIVFLVLGLLCIAAWYLKSR